MADKNVCTTTSLGSIANNTNAIVETGGTLARVNLATKVNRYSTSEIPVGTWIDGKTIYRKAWQFTVNAESYSFASGLTYSQIDTPIRMELICKCPPGITPLYCDGGGLEDDFFRAWLGASDSKWYIQGGTANPPRPYTAVIIFEYTKV